MFKIKAAKISSFWNTDPDDWNSASRTCLSWREKISKSTKHFQALEERLGRLARPVECLCYHLECRSFGSHVETSVTPRRWNSALLGKRIALVPWLSCPILFWNSDPLCSLSFSPAAIYSILAAYLAPRKVLKECKKKNNKKQTRYKG